jgi:hypothetical protein
MREALAQARGAAANLGQIALAMSETASLAAPEAAAPELLKHIALTVQCQSQKATLGAMSAGAAAARLAAYGHVLALESEAQAAARRNAAEAVAHEAELDAATYRRAVAQDGETEPAERWATFAFAAWVDDDERAIEPLTRDEARSIYVQAFMAALGTEPLYTSSEGGAPFTLATFETSNAESPAVEDWLEKLRGLSVGESVALDLVTVRRVK